MIDCAKFERRVNLLKNGKRLLLKHEVFGDHIVSMNPQHNRIFNETVTRESLSEDKLNSLLMWDCGDWYLYDPYNPTHVIVATALVRFKTTW